MKLQLKYLVLTLAVFNLSYAMDGEEQIERSSTQVFQGPILEKENVDIEIAKKSRGGSLFQTLSSLGGMVAGGVYNNSSKLLVAAVLDASFTNYVFDASRGQLLVGFCAVKFIYSRYLIEKASMAKASEAAKFHIQEMYKVD